MTVPRHLKNIALWINEYLGKSKMLNLREIKGLSITVETTRLEVESSIHTGNQITQMI